MQDYPTAPTLPCSQDLAFNKIICVLSFFCFFFPLDKSGPWKYWRGSQRSTVTAVLSSLSTVGQRELQQSLHVHLVEEFELCGQLMGFLPFGGELGALLVVVVVWQLLTCVGVPAKGPEAIKVDLVTHR